MKQSARGLPANVTVLVLIWMAGASGGCASRQARGAEYGRATPYVGQTPEQLQRLVAPIALYPDSLVAQILAASTFPEQVVEADRWLETHPDLKGQDLANAVNAQAWDASVKALTAFPAIFGSMDKNLSWTSSLGDAYYNQPQDVMNAVQVMRGKAQAAGTLETTPQQVVTTQGSTIVIQPASTEVVYVPAYDPWVVYGYPIAPWPAWYPYPGIWYDGPALFFGVGFGIGWYGGFGWGWPVWRCDWNNRAVIYNNNRYVSPSRTFYNRTALYRGGPVFNDSGARVTPFGNAREARGFGQPRGETGMRSGAFSHYGQGGDMRGFTMHGSGSFHGGFGGGGRGFGGGGPGFGGGGHR